MSPRRKKVAPPPVDPEAGEATALQPLNILQRLALTKWDIPAFARILGIEPHQGQIRAWEQVIQRDATRWRPLWLTIALSSGNRAGKTLWLAILLLHHTFHKLNIRPADPDIDRELDAWVKQPYHWYHFGIQQEVGELVFFEMTAMLEGRHPAQGRLGCPLTDALTVNVAETSTKERGEYRWVRYAAELGGGEIHFRTTNEKALGSLGKDMNGISFDECGFERNLTFIVNEVLHMRRMATGGPLILVSTPSEGFTEFSDEWHRGDPLNPQREPDHHSMRMSTRDNVGFGIDKTIFDRLVAGMPETLIPQNIDGFFIEGRQAFFNHEAVDRSFDRTLHDEPAIEGETYVHGIDPALRYDATWSIVLKTGNGNGTGAYAVRRKGKQTMVNVVAMVTDSHTRYSTDADCITGLDTTGFGGKIFKEALSHIPDLRSVEFGGTRSRKMKMLTDLKGMLEQGRLRFPREGVWLELRRQLLGYRLDDQGSDKGQNSDAVMALAIAVKMLLSRPEAATETAPFDFWGGEAEEVEPGYIPRGPTRIDREFALRRNAVVTRMQS